MKHTFDYDGRTFTYYDPDTVEELIRNLPWYIKIYKGIKYYQFPCAFDIETSNFMDGEEPRALMYHWQFSLNGDVICGRTWDELVQFIGLLTKRLYLSEKKRVLCFVHNLSFEFQWCRKWFEWAKVFSIENRKPIYAVTTGGIEFRCSYILTGLSLAKLGERAGVPKLSGDEYNYKKLRLPTTPLSDLERAYCISDVLILDKYIKTIMQDERNIAMIPLTKTGYVRRDCKRACYGTDHKQKKCKEYLRLMKYLTLEVEEYDLLKDAFTGGFTHANVFNVGKVIKDVDSIDFTSSYPTRIVGNLFPMSKGERYYYTNKADFLRMLKKYYAVFEIRFYKLRDKIHIDNPLSYSKCKVCTNPTVYNGRVVQADLVQTTITSVDLEIFSHCYSWSHFEIGKCYYYAKGYLPKSFVEETLKYYIGKTVLKGVQGKEKEYLALKENLNSLYGMMVTDPLRDMIIYEDGWQEPEKPNKQVAIKKYNNSKNRFTFYPWGLFVTAFSRRELWKGILECRGDYCYADTDSIKMKNFVRHKKWVDEYNRGIVNQLYIALDYHGLPHELIHPVNQKGEICTLGVWDYEGHYSKFITTGAKRYMVEYEDGTHNLTVSGLNKKTAIPYLEKQKENIFDIFKSNLVIPAGASGRTVSCYIDEPTEGLINGYHWQEKTSLNISDTTYSMDALSSYIKDMAGITQSYAVDGKKLIKR